MQPETHVNGLAVPVATLAAFAVGALWYGPLFGKQWAKEVGYPEDAQPSTGEMVRSMGLNVLGWLLASFVLAHIVAIWRPSTWGTGTDGAAWHDGLFAALFTWIGFQVPPLLNKVAFERKRWRLFFIDAGYQFLGLLAMATILAHWR